MFLDFFRKRSDVVDVEFEEERGRGEKRYRWIIVAIIAAIVILVIDDFGGEKTATEIVMKQTEAVSDDNYIKETEEKLEKMISTIKGAGKVNVMVVFETKGEKIPATDKVSQKEVENKGETETERVSDEENVILFGSGADEKPYVLEEKMPIPNGVFVSATGASNENIKLEIYEAVKALYGISGHRIKVSPAVR